MKTGPSTSHDGLARASIGTLAGGHAMRGMTLIEALIYISMAFLLLGMAYGAFHQTMNATKHLHRNAADIALALDAGERWRAEVRSATAPPRLVEENGVQMLNIPLQTNEVAYLLGESTTLRQTSTNAPWIKVLGNLRTSRLFRDERNGVVSWRWEIELKSELQAAHVRPMFSFQAVAAADKKP